MTSAAALLREARRRAGLSQRAAADAAGVRQPLVARIESGRQQPTLPTLDRLLRACGYALDTQLEALPDAHDLGLLDRSLALTPEQRIDRLITTHRTARMLRSATIRATRARA